MGSWFVCLLIIAVSVAYRRARMASTNRLEAVERLPRLCAELMEVSTRVLAQHEELRALPVPIPLISRRLELAVPLRHRMIEWRTAAYRAVNERGIEAVERLANVEEALCVLRGIEEAIHAAEAELNHDIHRWAEQEYHTLMPRVREVNDEIIREMRVELHRSFEALMGTSNPVRHPRVTEAFAENHSVLLALAHLWARHEIRQDPTIN